MPPDFKTRLAEAKKRAAEAASKAGAAVEKELPDMPEVKLDLSKSVAKPAPKAPTADWSSVPHETAGAVQALNRYMIDPAVKSSPFLMREVNGLLATINQAATGGYSDEIIGTVKTGLDRLREAVGGKPSGMDWEAHNQQERRDTAKAIGDSTAATRFVGGGLGGALPAALSAGGTVIEQIPAAAAQYLATLTGTVPGGNPLERFSQATSHVLKHPVEAAAASVSPVLMHGANKAAGKFANWFEDARLNQLGNLITTAADRTKYKVAEGTDAIRALARDAEATGLFKGSNWFTEHFGVPTAGRVSKNAAANIKTAKKDIDTHTEDLLGKAEARPDKNQQVDYGHVVERLEKLKNKYGPDTDTKGPAKQATVQKQIDYVKKKASRPGNSPRGEENSSTNEPAVEAEYSEPATTNPADISSNEPIDVESYEVHKAGVKQPQESTKAENVTPQDVSGYEPQAGQLPVGRSLEDQPNATRFSRKQLPENTTEPNPDELYTPAESPENASYDPETYAEPPASNLTLWTPPAALARRTSRAERVPGDPAMQEPFSGEGPPGADYSGPVGHRAGMTPREPDPTPEAPPSSGYWEDPNDPAYTPPPPWRQPPPGGLDQPPPLLERGGAPNHSVSLRTGMAAQKLAAKDVDFDPQVKPPTALQKQINKSRYVGHAEGNQEAMGNLMREDPASFEEPVMGLRDANHRYSVAKEVQYPASLIEERNVQHAITPRELSYGLLSGHGAAVAAARLGRGGVPGTLAKAAGFGENAGDAARAATGVVDDVSFPLPLSRSQYSPVGELSPGSSGQANPLGPRMELGFPRSAGAARVARSPHQDEPMLDTGVDALMNLGAKGYDALFGGTPRESVSERNERMSQSIKKRLEENE